MRFKGKVMNIVVTCDHYTGSRGKNVSRQPETQN